jgi:CubicO group peptidase (beta-lactamase class C family)
MRFSGLAVTAAIVAAWISGSAAQQPVSVTPAELSARLDAFIPAAMSELNVVPGVSIAVTTGDATIYGRGFGVANVATKAPVTPHTPFYAASMIKAFTGMTAAILATEKKLDLDAPLEHYFPGFILPSAVDPKQATLRGLLSHNAGFGNATINYVTSFVGPFEPRELIRVLNTYSQPLPSFTYANANFALAGYAIEKATGRPLRDVMTEKLLRPLGMNATTMLISKVGSAAKGYSAEREGFELLRLPKSDRTMTGAGGIFTTTEDTARFVRASLRNGRIDGKQALPAAAVELQQTLQAPVDATFGYFKRSGYGLGLYLGSYDGQPMFHHFGSISGYRSHMSWLPQRDAGVVVLQNEGGDGSRFADLVAAYAYDVLLGKADADARARTRITEYSSTIERARAQRDEWRAELRKAAAGTVKPALPLVAYVGRYKSERLGTIEVQLRGTRLQAIFGDASGGLLPAGGHAFLADWNPGGPPDRWTFQVEGTAVVGLDWGGRAFTKVK